MNQVREPPDVGGPHAEHAQPEHGGASIERRRPEATTRSGEGEAEVQSMSDYPKRPPCSPISGWELSEEQSPLSAEANGDQYLFVRWPHREHRARLGRRLDDPVPQGHERPRRLLRDTPRLGTAPPLGVPGRRDEIRRRRLAAHEARAHQRLGGDQEHEHQPGRPRTATQPATPRTVCLSARRRPPSTAFRAARRSRRPRPSRSTNPVRAAARA
jgi:hypothetical protein